MTLLNPLAAVGPLDVTRQVGRPVVAGLFEQGIYSNLKLTLQHHSQSHRWTTSLLLSPCGVAVGI